jgi:serine/threonine protein phosphatase PrpC
MVSISANISHDPSRAGLAIKPYKQGRFSGDQAGVWIDDNATLVCIADGLGHGEHAEVAAKKAVSLVSVNRELDLTPLLLKCDEELRGTRGAALALARIDHQSRSVDFVGIGNTRCATVGRQVTYLGSTYGIVGEGGFRPHAERLDAEKGDILLFWTDGLPETITLIASRVRRMTDCQAYADQLIHQYAKDEDDAGVVVVKLVI